MRILSLDYGERKIGMAVSDPLGITSQGLETIRYSSRKDALAAIKGVVSEKVVSKIVVGLPVNMDGTTGERARSVYAFIDELKGNVDVPITTWDERLTTMEANRVMLQADLSRKKRSKHDDKLAAQILLQSYLDSPEHNQT